jgi:hypothetical protein
MIQPNLEKLKKLVAEGKAKRPRKPVYSNVVKDGILNLTNTMSSRKISNELGVSLSLVEKVRKSSARSKTLEKSSSKKFKTSQNSSDFHFLQLPNEIKKEKNDDRKCFMKVTTKSGISIELWE